MKLTVRVGLILLVVILNEGAYGWLNLTDEVEKYIEHYINTEIVNFSLTDKVGKEMPNVTARVGELTYGDGCKNLSYVTDPNCSGVYLWRINNGINTPFSLQMNITLVYKWNRNETLLADVNNAGYIYWNPDNITMPTPSSPGYSEEKCNFSIALSFSGWFVYEVKSVNDDKPHNGIHGIGKVGYLNNKLVDHGENELLYNISGVLEHTVTCK